MELFQADLEFYEARLWTAVGADPPLVSLKAIRDLEAFRLT